MLTIIFSAHVKQKNMPKPVIPKPIIPKSSKELRSPNIKGMSSSSMSSKMPPSLSYDERISGMKIAAISLFVTLGTIVCLGLIALFFVASFHGGRDAYDRMSWRDLTSEMQNQRRYVEELQMNSQLAATERMDIMEKVSFVEYAMDRQAHEILNPPTSTYSVIATVQIDDCEVDADGPCGGELSLYAPANWAATTADQIFYLAHPGGAGLDWFGPYKDDLQRIVAEAQFVKKIAK